MTTTKKEIRENWFKNHKAEYKENDEVNILNWKNPKTNQYRLRYVMDGNFLYVSGDLNSAVYDLTWRATLKSFADINLGYFYKQLAAYEGNKIKFNSKKAEKSIQEEIEELKSEDEHFEEKTPKEHYKTLEEIKSIINDCSSLEQWKMELVSSGLYDRLSEFDVDCWEWIFEVGDDIPNSVKAHFIGLQIAAEQLNLKE